MDCSEATDSDYADYADYAGYAGYAPARQNRCSVGNIGHQSPPLVFPTAESIASNDVTFTHIQ